MMTDDEWDEVRPLLTLDIERIKDHREKTGNGLRETVNELRFAACERYYEITGFIETNPHALWHHYLKMYGPECKACGHLLRTPYASFCANCGTKTPVEPAPGSDVVSIASAEGGTDPDLGSPHSPELVEHAMSDTKQEK